MNKTSHRSKLRRAIVTCLLISMIAPHFAKAGIVVRSSNTTETEFQSMAMARGETPVSEFLTSETQRRISIELLELYRQRLLEAQAEWLSRTPGEAGLTPSIDRFLSLAYEADWAETERQSFATFFTRKFEMSNGDENARRNLRAYQNLNLGSTAEMSPNRKSEWEREVASDTKDWTSLSSWTAALPADITHILINGRAVERAALAEMILPSSRQRITLVSNVYQPATFLLRGDETSWPHPERQTWSLDGCTPNPTRTLDMDLKIAVLAEGSCHNSPTESKTEKVMEKFGLEPPSKTAWPTTGAPPEKAFYQKPWFWWSVAGALAIGAAIAIDRSQNQSSVRPVTRQDW